MLCIALLLLTCNLANGHGNMVQPMAWWDENQAGWNWDENGNSNHLGCGVLDLPTDTEFNQVNDGKDPDCFTHWFNNQVRIPGDATLPEDMLQPEVECVGQAGAKDDHPWYAPGTAPVFGPCGSAGGMPLGCNNDGEGSFGDCCSNNCDSYAMGDNAENYEWPAMPITEWKAGSFQEVAWHVQANHAGGYSYRLCKMPQGGIGDLTEECFQQNPLEFVSDVQWVQYNKDKNTGLRTELVALQTTAGTFPEGSMWRANPLLPKKEEGGSSDYGVGTIIDDVKVPTNLEPGQYVVSLR